MRGRRTLLLLGTTALAALLVVALMWAGPGPITATGGNSIASPDTIGTAGTHISLALDASGNPVVSYWDTADDDLKVLHCGNPNCTAGNSITSPDTVGNVGSANSLALDASGNPVVSYKDGANDDLKVLHCGNPNCTAGNSITSPDAAGNVGGFTSLTLDASGNPVVSYKDVGNDDLRVLHCGNPNCTAGNSITSPDAAGNVGNNSSLALDASGNPVVSYKDIGADDLKVLHCGNPNCTADNSITSPDSAGNVGGYTSLALDADGNPVVSYLEGTTIALKLLHCGNPDCTAGNSISFPDSSGSVGWYTSLALDSDGNPVVSYYEFNTGTVKLLHCGNPNCTAANSIASPDTIGHISFYGRLTSLALDSDGNPVVGYFDSSNGDLKVLHCGTPNCTADKPPTPTPSPTPCPLEGCPTPTVTPTPTPPVGDASCNGIVDSIDAALVLQLDAGLLAALLCQEFADVNEDGVINSIDAALILQFTAGLLDSLPP